MPRTEAQRIASQQNGRRGIGPVTPEGKAISSRNSYRHGMAGEGVVLPPAEAAEVDRRSCAMLGEMRPATEMGGYLVRRLARLTVRVERCADQESAEHSHLADHAAEAFDDARLAEMEHALGWIEAEPATHARWLRTMPEGVDLVIKRLTRLREEVEYTRWDFRHGEMVDVLLGRRHLDIPLSRVRMLSEAIRGNFQYLDPGDGAGLHGEDRSIWAREAMVELIDGELEALRAHRETLDVERVARDRASAALRAGFEPSKGAVLARRYEAAAERAIHKTLAELRRVEGEAVAASAEVPEDEEDDAPGSSGAGSSGSSGAGVPSGEAGSVRGGWMGAEGRSGTGAEGLPRGVRGS